MITREDLMGKPKSIDNENLISYQPGLLETFLPGEYNYHGKDDEGHFLASLCLYLLSNEEDVSVFFPNEYDRLFLEHFLFHKIPQHIFLTKMRDETEDKEKVKIICGLIKSDILLSTKTRFHDFYINSYWNCSKDFKTEEQGIFYCQHLHELFANGDQANWPGIYSVEMFVKSCAELKINIPDELKFPLIEVPKDSVVEEHAPEDKDKSNPCFLWNSIAHIATQHPVWTSIGLAAFIGGLTLLALGTAGVGIAAIAFTAQALQLAGGGLMVMGGLTATGLAFFTKAGSQDESSAPNNLQNSAGF